MLRTMVGVLLAVVVGVGCGGDPLDPVADVQLARSDAPVRLGGGDPSFGRAVAVAASGDLVAVAATDPVPGVLHVFELRGAGWTLAATLSPPGGPGDWSGWLGRGLAAARNRVAVGAPWAPGGGRVYVFQRVGARWELEAALAPSIATVGSFGRAVAFEKDTLLVGAPGGAEGGTVFVFERHGSGWVEVERLAPEEPVAAAQFGFALAVAGDTLAVGAPGTSLGPWGGVGDTAGLVYVFLRAPGGWRQRMAFPEPEMEYGGMFGLSVAMAPGVIVASCGCPDGDAYVFELVDGEWRYVAALQPGWATLWTNFGHEVAVSNGHAFVTAPLDEPAGVVLRWERTAEGWVADGELSVPDGAQGSQIGHAVAAAGDLVVVGAPRLTGETGTAWIFPAGAR